MPYRVDVSAPGADALDVLVRLGAIDVESVDGGMAAILPDAVPAGAVVAAFGGAVTFTPAVARDDDSVWLVRAANLRVGANELRLVDDAQAFGSGHHATTALCLEALQELWAVEPFDSLLDVGTGSGVLALAALLMGVARAVGVDTDAHALTVAAENAELNGLTKSFQLRLGGPAVVDGIWPVVVANVLAFPLIDMASVLVRRVGHRGRLILSGVPCSMEGDVRRAYQHFGMHHLETKTRDGWTALLLQASW